MVSIRGKKSRTDADRFDQGDLIIAMEKLQEVQDELEKINEEANREILKIEEKYNKVKEPVYARRDKIISSIPDFWLTAVSN
ncbi:hypothetical protein DH2020_009347 [Rehmannia glutinosa]|uniref:Uncharacterized protein n=1 Tax=Rehmannia glutinosa TaxID=99300 RepID=A0ABR0X916_REHGL